MKLKYLIIFFLFVSTATVAQTTNSTVGLHYLTVSPDARGAALGISGVSTYADNFSAYYNPAKLIFLKDKEYGSAASVGSWQPNGGTKGTLFSFAGFKRIDDYSSVGLDLRYMNYKSIPFYDENGYKIYDYSPNDYSVGLTYSRTVNDYLSFGFTPRYIRSSPALGVRYYGREIKSVSAFGLDAGIYYQSTGSYDDYTYGNLSAGLVLQNFGTKLKYLDSSLSSISQPTAIKFGVTYMLPNNGLHALSITAEPTYFFSYGFSVGGGLEYTYNNVISLRTGYRHDNPKNSDLQVITVGAGLHLGAVGIDATYYTNVGSPTGSPLVYKNSFTGSIYFQLDRL